MRLHAARLASGRYEVARAVEEMRQVPDPTYRAVEKGARLLGPAFAKIASGCFGVSEGFLLEGTAITGDDGAVTMLELLRRLDDAGVLKPDSGFRHRLQRKRREAGFRSATAAASTFGWVRSRYTDHENGRRAIPLDQAIRYAEKLVDDPFDLIVAPPQLVPDPQTSASKGSAAFVPDEHDSSRWQWLDEFGKSSTPGTIRAPVVTFTRSGAELLPYPMTVPAFLTPGASNGEALYWLVDLRARDAPKAFLLLASLSAGHKVIKTSSGLRIASTISDDAILADPLASVHQGDSPLVLGTLRHVMTVV